MGFVAWPEAVVPHSQRLGICQDTPQ